MSILDRLEALQAAVEVIPAPDRIDYVPAIRAMQSKLDPATVLGLVRVARAAQAIWPSIEHTAAREAYAAQLGASEWEAFLTHDEAELRSALASLEDADTKGGTT